MKALKENNLDDLKKIFLSQLKSRANFKRYNQSPLRYAGGKSLAVGNIVELIPSYVKKIVSPFIGGGSVEIACAKELNLDVIGYDVFSILVDYWQIQIEQPIDLYNNLLKLYPLKEKYYEIKNILKKHWLKEIQLPKLDLATYYFFNHNLSYGPSFLGWMSSIYLNLKKYYSTIEKVKNFYAKSFSVFCKDFKEAIPCHDGDFLYCDPPYFLEGDSKMFKGIYPQRNFPIHHNNFDHHGLRDILLKHNGGFILSYNDCSIIRDLYKKFKIVEVAWQYTMGQGETRIGKNRLQNNINHIKKSHEILILNI